MSFLQSFDGLACAMLAVYLDSASNVPVGALSADVLAWSIDDVLMQVLLFASRKTRPKSPSKTNKKKGR